MSENTNFLDISLMFRNSVNMIDNPDAVGMAQCTASMKSDQPTNKQSLSYGNVSYTTFHIGYCHFSAPGEYLLFTPW